MQFRLLTGQDGPSYQTLRLEALQTNPEAFLATLESEQQRHEHSFSEELELTYSPPHFGFWGAFDETADNPDTLVAICQVAPSYLPKQPHLAYLYSLYVTPTARHHHTATQLLGHVLAELNTAGIEQVYLTVVKANTAAFQFYQTYGFQHFGTRPQSVKWHNAYDDELEMVLSLL